MPLRDEKKFLPPKPMRWLLAALLVSAARGGEPLPVSPKSERAGRPAAATLGENRERQADSRAWESPMPPRPLAANRHELAAAFTKAAPTSLADLKSIEQRIRELVRRVSPAVVDVEIGSGTGSGVIISQDGLVLTAGHVCGKAGRDVRMTFPDGRKARGKTLGVSKDSDCGLIRITERGPWPRVPVGELDQARAGDWVLALGHPGGFDLKRSLVVRLGRIIQLEEGNLQTDCTISQGDSGGPLIDMFGRVIGIHSYISSSLTANFHVAITEFYQNWDQMLKKPEAPPGDN
jgi:serine protease Do